MGKLSKLSVLHVANLAKLKLTEKEVEKFTDQLSKVIDFIGHLTEADVKNIEPTAQVTGLESVYREDEVKSGQSLTQDESLAGSDGTHNGYFKVKAILTERSDK